MVATRRAFHQGLDIEPMCDLHYHTKGMANLTSRAIALLQQGDLEGARALFQFALDQRVAMFGADSPAVATELSNLGNLLAEQHHLTAARPLLERALKLRETTARPTRSRGRHRSRQSGTGSRSPG